MPALFSNCIARVNDCIVEYHMMLKPVKTTRADDVYQTLRTEIRLNRMPPGYQAPEPELALRLGVSRTTVREALIRLESEGLVELIPRRGARVLPLRAEDMREIYDILMTMEPDVAARLAARKPSDQELQPIKDAALRMEDALVREDLDDWAAADDQFHLSIFDLYGNRRLRSFVNSLNDQVHRARMITLRLRDLPTSSNEEHRDILKHIRTGDVEAARQAFLTHRERAAEELLNILTKSGIGQL